MSLPPSSPARYRIGVVAHETGIPVETLRIWERRYQVVTPERSPRGGRLYTEAHIARLRRIKQLVDRGHSIGQLAPLHEAQLEALLERTSGGAGSPDLAQLRARFIAAIERIDARGAQQILGRAALLLGTRTLLLDLVAPLLREIGARWAEGTLRICQEHLASATVRTLLGSLLATQPPGSRARTILIGTPSGEVHELGALLVALLAAVAGWDVVYLGPNLPVEEILVAAQTSGAAVVGVSVVHVAEPGEPGRVSADLAELAGRLPQTVTLLIGGAGAGAAASVARALRIQDLAQLDVWLRGRGVG